MCIIPQIGLEKEIYTLLSNFFSNNISLTSLPVSRVSKSNFFVLSIHTYTYMHRLTYNFTSLSSYIDFNLGTHLCSLILPQESSTTKLWKQNKISKQNID